MVRVFQFDGGLRIRYQKTGIDYLDIILNENDLSIVKSINGVIYSKLVASF